MKWITAADIKNWAATNGRDCQGALPELVSRLILATTTLSAIEKIEFPSGDSVAIGGWDGYLKTLEMSPFFPNGLSGWEMGSEASAVTKANKDYMSRVDDPKGLVKKESSFVFVTPRVWKKRKEWEKSKKAEGEWKDVQAIAADDLELWISMAPAVGLWLARRIKRLSDGIRDIEAVWEEWSLSTNPVMTTDLVIGGRTQELERIRQWATQAPAILEVRGDSQDEPLAFLYSAIKSFPEDEQLKALSRCIVVENINDLRTCTSMFQYPLIIAVPADCRAAAGAAIAKGHHVYLSADAQSIDLRNNLLELSRPQRSIVEASLIKNGLSEIKAQQLARDFGRSIPVLRRQLFLSSIKEPSWVTSESAQTLIPALLAGAWNENKEGDRQIIETLSKTNYASFVEKLESFVSVEDAPIRKVGNIWMQKSPLDAWFLLAKYLTNDSLNLFKQSLFAVLTKTDPKYELTAEKRWAAAVYGKSSNYSEWFRTGLVKSLVLLAFYGDRSEHVTSTQVFADNVVKEILTTADKWESWASLKDVMPLLAEAAPENFLTAVEGSIEKNSGLFKELMQDEPALFGDCRHCGLLWALEGTAWSPDYFVSSVSVLGKLAQIDSGGKWNNRAINSLKDVFLPSFPQTYATAEQRLVVLDMLITKFPKMVWEFALHYYGGGSFGESHRFRWRYAGGNRRGLEPEDGENNQKYLKGLLPKLEDLAVAKENLISATDEFTRLPTYIRDRLLEVLEKTEPTNFSKDEIVKLLQCIREALNWTNSYGDEERRKQVPVLNRILEKFTPKDVIERVGWLLSNPWPRLPEGEPRDYDPKEIAVKTAQKKAAREVLDQASLDEILKFASTVQYSYVLGYSLAAAVRDEKEDNVVLDALLMHADHLPILIKGYANGRVEVIGASWVDNQIERLKSNSNYSVEAYTLLYFGLPEGGATWSAVTKLGTEAEKAYWKQASGFSRANKNDDAPTAVEKLLDVERPLAALQIAGDPHASIPSLLLQRLIQELLEMNKKIQAGVMEEFHLGNVFNQLYARNELSIEEIAALEWPFAALFDEFKRYTSFPIALHRLLQKDPLFFSQLVSFQYKKDDQTPDTDNKEVSQKVLENRAHVAYEVLHSWRLLPGLKDDGTLDESDLTKWVETAREKSKETKHLIGADLQIGFMLARAPADPDGIWPHVAVRNLIERLNSEIIDDHIRTGIYNSRGVVSRSINDGGRQERETAQRYKNMSEAVKVKWPRTAAMLRSVSEMYENDAKREDIDSDLHDLSYD